MLVVIEKSEKERFEFEMDEEFKFLLELCSFCKSTKGYIYTCINKSNLHLFANYGYKLRQKVRLHRILFELHNNRKLEPGEVIDHMDMCKTNNKIVNLRAITNSENCKNRKLNKEQPYYNICHNKYHNHFRFTHLEKKIERTFTELKDALAFFEKYDRENDHVLTKHIHDKKPIEEVENVILTPDGHCEKCGINVWSKRNLKKHQKKPCN